MYLLNILQNSRKMRRRGIIPGLRQANEESEEHTMKITYLADLWHAARQGWRYAGVEGVRVMVRGFLPRIRASRRAGAAITWDDPRLRVHVHYAAGAPPDALDTGGEICSVPDCDRPIAGWCATCAEQGTYGSGRGEGVEQLAPQWCAEHLAAHCAAAPAGSEHTPHWLSGE